MLLFATIACNPDPGELDEQVGYRTADTGPSSGERGSIKISEVLWSGSVWNDEFWDTNDIFIEFRNESNRPVNLSGWHVVVAGIDQTIRVPTSDFILEVGAHAFMAKKPEGCLINADWVVPGLKLPTNGDPVKITLYDADERLIEPIGDEDMPPFGGGYDLVKSRSMERLELMFGGYGTQPGSWHYYTPQDTDIPNNINIKSACQDHTLASPGMANSPDYSGAYAAGAFE